MREPFQVEPEIDAFIAAVGARITPFDTPGLWGLYCSATDTICLRACAAYGTSGDYYSTLFHEHAHWTSHRDRLARSPRRDGDGPLSAMEELCAIVASIHLCTYFGIADTGTPSELSYAKQWLPVIAGHGAAIRYAVTEGRRAAAYLYWRASGGTRRGEECLLPEADNIVFLNLQCGLCVPDAIAQSTALTAAIRAALGLA